MKGERDFLTGTCQFMCPENERIIREQLRHLSVFERANGNPSISCTTLAVKKFCRTLSSKKLEPSEVRPALVLEDTLKHLLKLSDSADHPFELVHSFVFDRIRSIRQDLSIQNIEGDQAIKMYESMVRFYVVSHHRLGVSGSNSSNTTSTLYLNMEQLLKALATLYTLYDSNRSCGKVFSHEAELRSLYVLLHLSPNDGSVRGDPLSVWFRKLPWFVLKSEELGFCRKMLRYYRLGNAFRFLSIAAEEATCLQYYIIESHITKIRGMALACINSGGYRLHPYPLATMSKLLLMKISDVESMCGDCGLETYSDDDGNKFMPTKQPFIPSLPNLHLSTYPLLGCSRNNQFILSFI